MKRLALALLFVSALLCRGEDLKLVDGTVLHDVIVGDNWDDNTVSVRRLGSPAQYYRWDQVTSDPAEVEAIKKRALQRNKTQRAEIRKFQEEQRATAAANDTLAKARASSVWMTVRVTQVIDDGVLAVPVEEHGQPSEPDGPKRVLVSGPSQIGKPMVDDVLVQGWLYPCGVYQYRNKLNDVLTVARFATTAEVAAEVIDNTKQQP